MSGFGHAKIPADGIASVFFETILMMQEERRKHLAEIRRLREELAAAPKPTFLKDEEPK